MIDFELTPADKKVLEECARAGAHRTTLRALFFAFVFVLILPSATLMTIRISDFFYGSLCSC